MYVIQMIGAMKHSTAQTISISIPGIGTDFFFLESEKISFEPHSAHLFKRDFGRSTLQMDI